MQTQLAESIIRTGFSIWKDVQWFVLLHLEQWSFIKILVNYLFFVNSSLLLLNSEIHKNWEYKSY